MIMPSYIKLDSEKVRRCELIFAYKWLLVPPPPSIVKPADTSQTKPSQSKHGSR